MDAVSPTPAPLPLRAVPGPRGLPLVGNAFQIRPDRFHQQLEAWAARYGDKFRFSIGARRFLAVRDPEVVAALLRQRPDAFRKSRRLEEVTRELGFHGVFSANGDAWRRQRPVVLAGLDPAHIRTFLPALVRALREAVDRFVAAARQQLAADAALRERPANLIQALVAANERGEASMSDAEVAGNVLTMLLAGEDTTGELWSLLPRTPTRWPGCSGCCGPTRGRCGRPRTRRTGWWGAAAR